MATAVVDDYTPMYQGATLPVQNWTFQQVVNGVVSPLPLTGGVTLIWYLFDDTNNTQVQGAGSWTITNAPAGQATYTFGVADTQNPFEGFIVVHITNANGTYVVDPKPFQVLPLFFLSGD